MKTTGWKSRIAMAGMLAALASAGCSSKESAPAGSASGPAANPPATAQPADAGLSPNVAPAGSSVAPKPEPSRAAEAKSDGVSKPAPRTIPAGTRIRVRTTNSLSTKTATAGEAFEGSLAEALVVNGQNVAPRGAPVRGVVAVSDPGGRVKGRAQLSVRITSVDGMAVTTAPVSYFAKGTKKRDAAAIGITSGVGAAIGAIAGGGKGAAIGAGAGAGAGTAGVLATRGAPAVIPAESVLTFTAR